jgi:AraC-like DNA-binding protein
MAGKRSGTRTLARPVPGASVTAVAMNFGFFHLGRFATSYRKRFGESPSETLRHGRARCGLEVGPAA